MTRADADWVESGLDRKKPGKNTALAGVAQWSECWPVSQRLTSSIPSQGTCLGSGPGPQQGLHKRQPHTDVSIPLSLLSLSLKINK